MDDFIKDTVRLLRKKQTFAEKIFWEVVRNRQIANYKIVRQFPIIFDYYGKERFLIADFYCHKKFLIIEIDGSVHDQQEEYDQLREYLLKAMDYEVIRFTNNEVINNLDEVINKLEKRLKKD